LKFVKDLPKTRSAKIVRRVIRAKYLGEDLGDLSSVENPDAIVYKLQLFTPFPGTELFRYASRLGMKFPESLEEWATYHYDKINYDGFNAKHKKFLKDIHYYTTFLDTKLLVDQSQYLELISKLYSKILKFRLDHEFYSLMYEHYPLRSSQKIRKRLLGKNI